MSRATSSRSAFGETLTTSVHAISPIFAPAEVLARAHAHSERNGYLSHEFGDSWLLL